MYGIKFTSRGRIKANSIQGQISVRDDSSAREVKLELSERSNTVAELRKNPDVLKATRYDIATERRYESWQLKSYVIDCPSCTYS